MKIDFISVSMYLLKGFSATIQIFLITLMIALPLGLIIAFGSMSRFKPLQWLMRTFVWIIRGTPLMLQLIVVYYVPGILSQGEVGLDAYTATYVTFSINYACYFSEIYRGGIQSIPRGQYEAGQVLGMTRSQVFFKVVLLQVVKRIIPPMSNEIITLVKDTSLARTITYYEIISHAYDYSRNGMNSIVWPLLYSGAFYLLFCGILTLLFGFIEKKLSYFQ